MFNWLGRVRAALGWPGASESVCTFSVSSAVLGSPVICTLFGRSATHSAAVGELNGGVTVCSGSGMYGSTDRVIASLFSSGTACIADLWHHLEPSSAGSPYTQTRRVAATATRVAPRCARPGQGAEGSPHVATISVEAGKRDQAQNEGQIRKIPRRSKVNPFAYQLDFA